MSKDKAKVKTIGRKLRPSNADRYLNCSASVVAAQDLPVPEGTVYTNKGTVVHALIENWINTGKPPEDYLGQVICESDMEVTQEMIPSAQFCIDYIKSQGFTTIEAEQFVDLPWIKNPDGDKTTGKVDFVGYDADFEVLKVGDYKDGYMPVPLDSYQFGMYFLPLMMKKNSPYKHLKEGISVLIQPNSKYGEIKEERTWTREELKDLDRSITIATSWVAKTKYEDLTESDYCEGHWCKFCPLANASAGTKMCPKKTAALFEDISGTDALDLVQQKSLPAPTTMTREQRALVLGKRKQIKKWLDDVYEMELTNAQAGDILPGMQLREGRTLTRYWHKGAEETDIVQAMENAGLLNDEIFDSKLISPATVKKILKGKITPELAAMMTPEGKSLELVTSDDEDLFD